MSAPYYSPYSPPMTSPYSPYAQPGGGYPGMGQPQQPDGLGQLPETPQDSFAPGAEAAPPQGPEAPGGGEGPQVPTTVFAYKGGFADKNTSLPDGNDAWRNYWMGVGGVGGAYATLAGIAAWRSGRGLGALKKALWPGNILKTGKVAWSGGAALRKSVLEGHFPLKFKIHDLAGKSKESTQGLTEELSKNVEAHVNHTKGLFTTTSEESDKMGHLQTAWNDYKTHLDVKEATDKTIGEKYASLLDKFSDIEKNIFALESNKDVYAKPIDAHLTSAHSEAVGATKALKPSEGAASNKEATQKLHQTAAEKLWIWKNSVETLKGPSDSLKTLAIKPEMNETERAAIETTLEGLEPLTGKPKAAAAASTEKTA